MPHSDPSLPASAPAVIDTSTPHPARVYDFYLGGKDNYPADEELGRRMLALEPGVRDMARSNRAVMRRVTRWAAEEGMRQFLDIGTGIPTAPNLHQVAQEVAPEARVVYCDNDPIVLAHAEALMTGTPEGVTAYVQGDAREPGKILEEAAKILDFDRPVQLSLIALLHFISDEQGAHEIVATLRDALAPGSQLVVTQAGFKANDARVDEADERYRAGRITLALRPREEIARFFEGFTFVEPGLVGPDNWRPELGDLPDKLLDTATLPFWVGVARKP
ncbi:SAM-dependent methyltransferase [Streptomyces sp. NPDC088923]|uniref:SAM-dependent methyltransferase n=1 Tax=Streptomyces sp. NPDC088923 TaxID=3365913 RepID=UPI0037FE38B4